MSSFKINLISFFLHIYFSSNLYTCSGVYTEMDLKGVRVESLAKTKLGPVVFRGSLQFQSSLNEVITKGLTISSLNQHTKDAGEVSCPEWCADLLLTQWMQSWSIILIGEPDWVQVKKTITKLRDVEYLYVFNGSFRSFFWHWHTAVTNCLTTYWFESK